MRLLLTTFLLSCCLQSRAQGEAASDVLKIGIDQVTSVLRSYEDRCSYGDLLMKDKYTNAQFYERNIWREWESLNNCTIKVQTAVNKTKDLIEQFYQLSPTPLPDACALPFRRAAGGCFWAHKNPGQTWDAARRFCQQEGGDLATPEDMGAMMEFAEGEFGHGLVNVFFGGRKYDGLWKWATTMEPMNVPETLFLSSSQFSSDGSCGALNADRGFKIMWWDCEDSAWFICEKKIST